MSRVSRIGGYALRLGLAVCIFWYLFYRLNNSVFEVEFELSSPAQAVEGAVYADAAAPTRNFTVTGFANDNTLVRTVYSGNDARSIAASGVLRPLDAVSPAAIAAVSATTDTSSIKWCARKVTPAGIRISAGVFISALKKWKLLLCGLLLFPAATAAITLRWKLVLDRQGVPVPFMRCLSASFIGQFFNWFMLGATGGDLAKAYFVAMETTDRKPEVVSTVFIDRLLGLPSLVIFADVVMLARARFFLAHPLTRASLYFLLAATAAIAVLLLAAFWQNLFQRWQYLRTLKEKTRGGRMAQRVYDAFYRCRQAPGLMAWALLVSILAQFAMVVVYFFLGRALELQLPFGDYVLILPPVMIAAAIPLTPGGAGVREGALVAFMSVLGVPVAQSLPLALLFDLTIVAWSIVGGVLFLLHPGRKAMRDRQFSDVMR